MTDPPFSGFTDEQFSFFRQLARNNRKEWFDRNRERYQTHVVGAFRALLRELEPFLLKLNPGFETLGKTNRNFSRINRDIRFTRDKAPYRTHYYLYLFVPAPGESHPAARLYVGLAADGVTAGFSIYDAGREAAMNTIFRRKVLATGSGAAELLALVRKSGAGRRYDSYWYTVDKSEWTRHDGIPRASADWKRMKGWVVRKRFAPSSRDLSARRFLPVVKKIFRELYPLYAFCAVAPRARSWSAAL
jgi:uncharacterized protein (TIGR02453 family)